jgi:hypothetical protein
MKQQYYHFQSPTQWPEFIYNTLKELEGMKKQSGGTVTTEIYNKTLDVAVWMQRITDNKEINNNIK